MRRTRSPLEWLANLADLLGDLLDSSPSHQATLAAGLTCTRGPWGSRTYRDPRFDTLATDRTADSTPETAPITERAA